MSSRYFALLDLGGTGLKTAMVQVGTNKLENVKRKSTPPFISQEGLEREIDPVALLTSCKELLADMNDRQREFEGLLVSGQMGGWILSDEQDRTLGNLVTWQDLRSLRETEDGLTFSQKAQEAYGPDWIKGCGNEMRPGLPAVALFEHFEHFEVNKYPDAPIRFHSLISWIVAGLSEEYVFSTHPTDIASSGLYLIQEKTFAESVLDILKVKLIMPEVKEGLHIVGHSHILNCPIYSGVGDQQSSLLGAGLNAQSTVVNIGTGGQVARLAGGTSGPSAQIRPYFDGDYIVTRTHLPSGLALSAFVQFLRAGSKTDLDFEWMSQSVLEFEPGTPRDVDNFEAEIRQLKTTSTKESKEVIASSVIHAMAQKYVEALAEIGHRRDDVLLFAGGVGQRMKSLPILIGGSTQSKFAISQTEETTLQGLANLSLSL